jgi:hypothetical protein
MLPQPAARPPGQPERACTPAPLRSPHPPQVERFDGPAGGAAASLFTSLLGDSLLTSLNGVKFAGDGSGVMVGGWLVVRACVRALIRPGGGAGA